MPTDEAGESVPLKRAIAAFRCRFDRSPTSAAVAPGRVNLIGEHTDYNDGWVLPMAIDRHVAAVAGPADDGWHLYSCDLDQRANIALADPIEPGEPAWTNYIRGVIAGFQRRGVDTPPLAVAVASDVPIGGGLSSSAALEVATATLLEQVTDRHLDPFDKALLCQWAEHHYAGAPCGLMDQYTAVMGKRGHLVLLDCRSKTSRHVPLDNGEVVVLIANTCVRHELTGGEYAERRAQCEEAARRLRVPSLRSLRPADLQRGAGRLDPTVLRRARHVVGEIARTAAAAEGIERRDWAGVGRLMYESHASLRDDFEVSCDELDAMVEAARSLGPKAGVYGSRMTGGGFGGCTVSLIAAREVDRVAEALQEMYQQATGIEPVIFPARPSDGAHAVDLP